MQKARMEFNHKDWITVSRISDESAEIKIVSMCSKSEIVIEVPSNILLQMISQSLVAFGQSHSDEIANTLAMKIVRNKEANDFAENEGDRFYKECHQPKPVIYSREAFADLFNPRV